MPSPKEIVDKTSGKRPRKDGPQNNQVPQDWHLTLNLIERCRRQYHKNTQRGDDTFSAFNALMLAFQKHTFLDPDFSKKPDLQQEISFVPVPWWALRHLMAAIDRYMHAGPGTTFGEVLKLEGGGQGRQRVKDRLAARIDNAIIGLVVLGRRAQLLAEGKKDEAKLSRIYTEVSRLTGYSLDAVEKAYKKVRKRMGTQKGKVGDASPRGATS